MYKIYEDEYKIARDLYIRDMLDLGCSWFHANVSTRFDEIEDFFFDYNLEYLKEEGFNRTYNYLMSLL